MAASDCCYTLKIFFVPLLWLKLTEAIRSSCHHIVLRYYYYFYHLQWHIVRLSSWAVKANKSSFTCANFHIYEIRFVQQFLSNMFTSLQVFSANRQFKRKSQILTFHRNGTVVAQCREQWSKLTRPTLSLWKLKQMWAASFQQPFV